MKNIVNLIRFKNISITLIILALSIPLNNAIKAQDTDFDFTVEITDASSENNYEGSVTITVDGRSSRYTFMIYDKDPLKGGKEILSSKSNNIYTVSNLKPGNYSVCVKNKDKATRCKNISIEKK
jgi:negative regulator of sigma E activity